MTSYINYRASIYLISTSSGRKGELISSETKQLDGISCSSYQYGSLESESPMLFTEQVVCDKNTVTERDEPIPAQGVYIKSRIELLPEIAAEATHMCLRSLIETDLDYSRNTKYEVEGIGGVYNPTETKYQNFSKFAWRTGNIYLGFFHRDYAIINQDKTPYNVNLTLEYCIANTTHSEAKTVNSSLYMVSCLEIDHLQEGELASIELIIGPHVLYEFNVDYESDCMISTYSHNEGHLMSGMFVGIALGIAIALLVIAIISVACVKKYCVLKSKVTARGFEHVSE